MVRKPEIHPLACQTRIKVLVKGAPHPLRLLPKPGQQQHSGQLLPCSFRFPGWFLNIRFTAVLTFWLSYFAFFIFHSLDLVLIDYTLLTMLSSGLTLSGAAAALLSASAVAQAAVAPTPAGLYARQSTGTGKCTDVHVFVAKGNNEPYPGRQGKLVNAICEGYDSCDYEDIVMQNMLPDPYCDSVHEGGANTAKQVVAYNKKCPDTKLVLTGYSQGAHALGDGLSGGGGVFFQGCVEKSVEPLDPKSSAAKAGMSLNNLLFLPTTHGQALVASRPSQYAYSC